MADFFWFSDSQWSRIEPLLPVNGKGARRVDDRRVTPGNAHDMRVAKQCIAAMPPSAELVGDKGYDSDDLRAWLASRGTQAVIPPKRNRKVKLDCDLAIYKQRNVVERMFCRFKDWRRVATRYDRNNKTFMATIAIAATVIWWLN